MTDGLLHDTVAGIYENDCQVGCGCARDHVSGILDMSRSVGNDEFAFRGGEISVSHVYSDSLFAFSTETVGEEREVHFFVASAS